MYKNVFVHIYTTKISGKRRTRGSQRGRGCTHANNYNHFFNIIIFFSSHLFQILFINESFSNRMMQKRK